MREGVWIAIDSIPVAIVRFGWVGIFRGCANDVLYSPGEKMRTRKASKKAETFEWAKLSVARQKPLPLRLWEELGKPSVGCELPVAWC